MVTPPSSIDEMIENSRADENYLDDVYTALIEGNPSPSITPNTMSIDEIAFYHAFRIDERGSSAYVFYSPDEFTSDLRIEFSNQNGLISWQTRRVDRRDHPHTLIVMLDETTSNIIGSGINTMYTLMGQPSPISTMMGAVLAYSALISWYQIKHFWIGVLWETLKDGWTNFTNWTGEDDEQ